MANAADATASIYDVFAQSQQQFLAEWSKAIATFQDGARAAESGPTMAENTRAALEMFDAWKGNTAKYLDILMSACPGNTGTDTFSRVFRAADAFTKLYDVWEPLATAMQQRAIDPEAYRDLFDPAKYAETVQQMFGFGEPSRDPGSAEEMTDLLQAWSARGQEFLQPWADAMRSSMDAALAVQSGDLGAALEVFRSLHRAFEGTFGRFLDMPAVGKDREQVELISRTIDRYALFLARMGELQRHLHTIAQQAMEKVVQTMAQRVKQGEPIRGFGEFVQLWTKTNEEAFLAFFRTPEYSELQGVVLDTAVDCRRQFRQLMEKVLADLPVALSSELDDLAQKNYDLNKSVRALKKRCAELEGMRADVRRLQRRLAAVEKKLAAAESSGDAESDTQAS